MAETDTNSILREVDLPRLGLFGSSPASRPGTALVLFRSGQTPVTLRSGQQLSRGEMFFGKYTTAYEVEMREQSFTFSCSLPSNNAAYEFQAKVHVSYRVDDPAAVVEEQITNPPEVLEPLLVQKLRQKSRQYAIEAVDAAEPGLASAIKEGDYGRGLTVTEVLVTLTLDASAREHVHALKEMQREREIKLEEIRHQKVVEQEQAELEQVRELQRQQLLDQRLQFYDPLIQAGNWQMLGLLLANNPDDVHTVAEIVREQHHEDFGNFLDAIKMLLDEDVLESFDLGHVKTEILERFVHDFSTRTGGSLDSLPGTAKSDKTLEDQDQSEQEDDADGEAEQD